MRLFLSLAALTFAAAPPIRAHHSFAAEYASTLIVLKATVVRFVWMNPHTRLDLDATGASGAVTKWECEGNAPGGLLSNGWTRGQLKPGDHVTIEAFPAKERPAKDGPNICKVRAVTLDDGTRLIMGSAGDLR